MRIPKSILTTLEGLLWAAVGGAATSLLEIRQYMTNWKEFDIDYAHVARLAAAGAILGGSMFLRELAQRRNVAIAAAAFPPGVYPMPAGMMEPGVAMGGLGSIPQSPIRPAAPGEPKEPGS